MAGLGGGTALQRFAQGLMDVDIDDDKPIERLLAKTLGFQPTEQLQKALKGESEKLQKLRAAYDAAQGEFLNEKDPAKRKELQTQYTAVATALETSIRTLGELGEEAGMSRAATLTQVDVGRALRESNFLDIGITTRDGEKIAAGIVAEQTSAHSMVSSLLSDDAVKRLGSQGVEHADRIQKVTNRIGELAQQHTKGDLGKLLSGDFKVAGGTDADQRAVMIELGTLRRERRAATEWVFTNSERTGKVSDEELKAAESARDKVQARAGETLDKAISTLYGRKMTHDEVVEQVGGAQAYARLLSTDGAADRLSGISKVVDEDYKLRAQGGDAKSWGIFGSKVDQHRAKHSDVNAEFFNLRDSVDKNSAEDPRRRGLQKLLDESVKDTTAATDVNMKVEVANLHIKRDGVSTMEMSGKSTTGMARGTA
jgi:hypothetical protein